MRSGVSHRTRGQHSSQLTMVGLSCTESVILRIDCHCQDRICSVSHRTLGRRSSHSIMDDRRRLASVDFQGGHFHSTENVWVEFRGYRTDDRLKTGDHLGLGIVGRRSIDRRNPFGERVACQAVVDHELVRDDDRE